MAAVLAVEARLLVVAVVAAPVLEVVVVQPQWTHMCRELVEQRNLSVVDNHEEASEVSVWPSIVPILCI